jgi:hypothetical protein
MVRVEDLAPEEAPLQQPAGQLDPLHVNYPTPGPSKVDIVKQRQSLPAERRAGLPYISGQVSNPFRKTGADIAKARYMKRQPPQRMKPDPARKKAADEELAAKAAERPDVNLQVRADRRDTQLDERYRRLMERYEQTKSKTTRKRIKKQLDQLYRRYQEAGGTARGFAPATGGGKVTKTNGERPSTLPGSPRYPRKKKSTLPGSPGYGVDADPELPSAAEGSPYQPDIDPRVDREGAEYEHPAAVAARARGEKVTAETAARRERLIKDLPPEEQERLRGLDITDKQLADEARRIREEIAEDEAVGAIFDKLPQPIQDLFGDAIGETQQTFDSMPAGSVDPEFQKVVMGFAHAIPETSLTRILEDVIDGAAADTMDPKTKGKIAWYKMAQELILDMFKEELAGVEPGDAEFERLENKYMSMYRHYSDKIAKAEFEARSQGTGAAIEMPPELSGEAPAPSKTEDLATTAEREHQDVIVQYYTTNGVDDSLGQMVLDYVRKWYPEAKTTEQQNAIATSIVKQLQELESNAVSGP